MLIESVSSLWPEVFPVYDFSQFLQVKVLFLPLAWDLLRGCTRYLLDMQMVHLESEHYSKYEVWSTRTLVLLGQLQTEIGISDSNIACRSFLLPKAAITLIHRIRLS